MPSSPSTPSDLSTPVRLGLVQVCLAGVLWGTGGLAVHVIRDAEPMSVVTISAWRMLIGAAVLLAAVAVVRQLGAPPRAGPRPAPGAGAASSAWRPRRYQALYFAAVVAVGVTVSTVVSLGLAPVVVTVVESVRRRRDPDVVDLLVLAAALVGLVLVSVSAGSAGGPDPVLRACSPRSAPARRTPSRRWSATTSPGPPRRSASRRRAPPSARSRWRRSTLVTGVGVGALGDPVVRGTLVYLGVLTMGLAYLLFYAGLRTAPGSSAVIATLLEPVTAAVLAALVLDERLGAAGVLGGVLILAAVAGLGRRPAVPPPG